MNRSTKREVMACLIQMGRKDLARALVNATYTLDDASYQKWPEPHGWDTYPSDRASKFGDHRVMSYQHIGDSIGTIVTFDGEPLVLGKGTPTWSYDAYGVKSKGTWSKTAEIPKILNDILKNLRAEKTKYMAMLERKHQVPGWELLVLDGSDLAYQKDLAADTDWSMSVTFFDADESPEYLKKRGGSWYASIKDTGTYEDVTEQQQEGTWKSFGDIPKVLKKYENHINLALLKAGRKVQAAPKTVKIPMTNNDWKLYDFSGDPVRIEAAVGLSAIVDLSNGKHLYFNSDRMPEVSRMTREQLKALAIETAKQKGWPPKGKIHFFKEPSGTKVSEEKL